MQKCPIYNTTNACDVNPTCLFLRNGGCAVVLAATLAEQSMNEVKRLSDQVSGIQGQLQIIANSIER